MKFNPLTKELFTDDYVFIKEIHCPYRIAWEALTPNENNSIRNCDKCEKAIHDTANLSDAEVLTKVRQDPSTCLKLDANQDNLKVITIYGH